VNAKKAKALRKQLRESDVTPNQAVYDLSAKSKMLAEKFMLDPSNTTIVLGECGRKEYKRRKNECV
jgi:hypothetical protein